MYVLEIVAQAIPLLAPTPVIAPHVILFVDNEPAKHAFNRGYSKDQSLNLLLHHVWTEVESNQWGPTWRRVPTESNIADAVSRFDFARARQEGWQLHDYDFEGLLHKLLTAATEGL